MKLIETLAVDFRLRASSIQILYKGLLMLQSGVSICKLVPISDSVLETERCSVFCSCKILLDTDFACGKFI